MDLVMLLLFTKVMEKTAATTSHQHGIIYQKMTYTFSRQQLPQAHSKGILNFLFCLFVSLYRLLTNYANSIY